MIPSELQSVANHLWQSTLFAIVVGVLTLVLRKNRAQVRYWLWLAASVKFLVPFSLLVGLGSDLGRHRAPEVEPPAVSYAIEQASEPFSMPAVAPAAPAAPASASMNWVPTVLYFVWAAGCAVLILSWWRRWRGLRATLRTASPVDLQIGVDVMSSPAFAEPGVFGMVRPVLLLPAGITDRLTPSELQAILAHELCHIRRRDNLATAIHMGVEALFWFHPLVWWLGARLMEERERACDEEVLLAGNEPEAYAEGILKICELYLESPLQCVSGVTGANLRKRIEVIMSGRAALRLSAAKKAVLAAAGAAAVLVPVVVGVLHAPAIQAQPATVSAKFEVASIKACKGGGMGGGRGGKKGGGGGRIRWDPERLNEECQSVYNLIRDAYLSYPEGRPWISDSREDSSPNARGVENGGCTGCGIGLLPVSWRVFRQEIQGSPAWVNSDRYTIDAKAEHPASPEMMRGPMMQALLEERFKLKIHRESRELPVYELTVAAGRPKVALSAEGSCLTFSEMMKLPPRPPAGGYHGPIPCGAVMFHDGKAEFPGTTMAGLCRNLSQLFDRDVIDKTGRSGYYNVEVDANRVLLPADDSEPPPDGMPPRPPQIDRLATAKEFQRALPKIGLKLEAAKGAGTFLVIDHIERPSGN